jgi:hypothetical protein
MQVAVRIQLRRDTAANWSSVNPILGNGEMGVETDTLKIKVGNGTSTWSARPYINVLPSELEELAQDSVNSVLIAGIGIDKVYDDANNTLTLDIDSTVTTNSGTQTLTNKTLTSPVINTPTGITKSDVGLANVDNTTDANKPISTATQTAFDLKAPIASPTFTGTVTIPTGAIITLPVINNVRLGYTSTSTAAGTTTLTVDSNAQQRFTGTSSQNVALPLVSTLVLGQSFYIDNNSSGNVNVNSSGGNLVAQLPGGTAASFTCVSLTGTTATSWRATFQAFSSVTGTGSNVLANSPTFTGTVAGITSTMVGLGNVDNTSDANKPISTATQTSLDLKAPLASPTFTGAVTLPNGTITSAMIADSTIVDTDISASAAIALSKLATDPLARANHTGQQTASTISDFNEAAQDAIGNVVGSGLTYSDASGAISVDLTTIQSRILNVTDTEIGYLDGVTSSIQTQLNDKLASATAATTYAPIASPTFTGTVTIPSGANISGFAPLASPALTGVPTAPTAVSSTNTTQIATTAYVKSVVSDLTNGAGAAYDTLKELQDLIVADEGAVSSLTTLVGTKAPIASPTFTGTVTIPTGAVISSPTISGTGTIAGTFTGNLTGNVTGNVTGSSGSTTGNAATVTNGVYTTGSYSNPTWLSLNSLAVGLGNVENTAISTFPGSTAIVSLGTVTAGTWSADTILPTKGGTGFSAYTTGDILYSSATNTLSRLNVGSTGQILTVASGIPTWADAPITLPTQTSNAGKYLTTDGTTAGWATVDALPSQTSNSGKYLTTNGTTATWAVIPASYTAPTIGGVSITSGGTFSSFSNITLTGNITVPEPTTNSQPATKLYTDTKAATERTYTNERLEIVPLDDVSTDFNGSNTRFIPKVGGAKITILNPLRLLVNINGIIQMLGNQDNHWLSPIVPDGFYIDSEGYMQFGEPVPTGSTFDARLMSGKTSNTLEKSRYPFRATDILLGA